MPLDMVLIKLLSDALARDELVFYYQPKVSMLSGKVTGAEALLRWIKPDGRVIPPAEFIPLAEASGFIREITRVMFPKLVADMIILQDFADDLSIAFNASAQDFETPELLNSIRRVVAERRLDPSRLQVELTEYSVCNSGGGVREHAQALVDMGVTLALDDFGTGYSSADLLSQWPFSVVKLDQVLIQHMLGSEKGTTIVQSTISMAHQLGYSIVAEGIENQGMYDFLLRTGCTDAQGYWLGRPMPLADFLNFLRRDQRWSGFPIGLIHMAQLDHIHWRRTLIDEVIGIAFNGSPVAARGISVEMDPHCCNLGRWYYGLGQEFKGFDAFDRLDLPHAELHAIGRELAAGLKQDLSQVAIIDLLRRLTRQSGIVLSLLQELESEAMLRLGNARAAAVAA